ncbi:hypothetical protein B0T21DRAFT_347397 [Apiosordaria backusii]|uniref:Uncharacterized protein n=1 Tax=Apiosordaria backusii TaxID=314023 RepID=A0AA40BML2_9PEZI|nr:hypothetical protein B0T21DRAFT_347397 [Apiosordaria backusii]
MNTFFNRAAHRRLLGYQHKSTTDIDIDDLADDEPAALERAPRCQPNWTASLRKSCRRRTCFPPGSVGGAEGQCPATVFGSHLVTPETCFRNSSQSPCRGLLVHRSQLATALLPVVDCRWRPILDSHPPRGQNITTHILHNSRQPQSPSRPALCQKCTRTLPDTGLLGERWRARPCSGKFLRKAQPSHIESTNTDTASVPELSTSSLAAPAKFGMTMVCQRLMSEFPSSTAQKRLIELGLHLPSSFPAVLKFGKSPCSIVTPPSIPDSPGIAKCNAGGSVGRAWKTYPKRKAGSLVPMYHAVGGDIRRVNCGGIIYVVPLHKTKNEWWGGLIRLITMTGIF